MKVGFTGTQRGMTKKQKVELEHLLADLNPDEFHHGDCIGADEQAHIIAGIMGFNIIIHPPEDGKKRAFMSSPFMHPKLPYLVRNKNIVLSTQVLIAAPKSKEEELRSGTWSTVRLARKMNRTVYILEP